MGFCFQMKLLEYSLVHYVLSLKDERHINFVQTINITDMFFNVIFQ